MKYRRRFTTQITNLRNGTYDKFWIVKKYTGYCLPTKYIMAVAESVVKLDAAAGGGSGGICF